MIRLESTENGAIVKNYASPRKARNFLIAEYVDLYGDRNRENLALFTLYELAALVGYRVHLSEGQLDSEA
jgi:hypothetical protein